MLRYLTIRVGNLIWSSTFPRSVIFFPASYAASSPECTNLRDRGNRMNFQSLPVIFITVFYCSSAISAYLTLRSLHLFYYIYMHTCLYCHFLCSYCCVNVTRLNRLYLGLDCLQLWFLLGFAITYLLTYLLTFLLNTAMDGRDYGSFFDGTAVMRRY